MSTRGRDARDRAMLKKWSEGPGPPCAVSDLVRLTSRLFPKADAIEIRISRTGGTFAGRDQPDTDRFTVEVRAGEVLLDSDTDEETVSVIAANMSRRLTARANGKE